MTRDELAAMWARLDAVSVKWSASRDGNGPDPSVFENYV